MDDDNLAIRRQVSKIFKEKFQSPTVQRHHEAYLDHLREKLNHWKSETNEKVKQLIKEKTEEINQFYTQYCRELNEKYANINQQIQNKNSSLDINDQIENFNIYCQSNTIENCIRLNTKSLSKDELAENIELEYIQCLDPPTKRIIEPLKSPTKESPVERLKSPIKESPIERLKSPIREKSPIERLRSPTKESPIERLRSPTKESPIERLRSPTKESPIERLRSPTKESPIERLRSPTKESPIERLKSPIKESLIRPLESTVKERIIEPLKSIVIERTDSIHSIHTSSVGSPVPVPADRRSIQEHSKYEFTLKPESNASREEPFTSLYRTITKTTNDNVPKTPTRLYIGKNKVLTPVLVGKDREVYNETEKITEYSIDSIPIPQDQQEQFSDVSSENDMTLVFAYKVLIQDENDYQQLSISSSDHEEEEEEEDDDDDDDEYQTNINKKFNLKKYNQINYSTIMFKKCETEYNCIASSTKRNELILYNSKLNVLMMLQYQDNQQCRQRFYLQWPTNLSPTISDITYCQNIDHFLISTWDSSHIYLFDRDSLSIRDLGKLSNDLPLRRIHCYQQTIYCIISNNYLLEYQIDEQYSCLTIIRKIKLFNPIDHSQDPVYYLLDITCDENYLIIIYSNEHDEIHLQSIIRQTREFHQDILLDIRQPINQVYIRIESTRSKGNFLYLNGSEQHLKGIDLVNYNKGKITSIMRRHTKPTNICFLQDKRLVILYEHPYFLSVHDLNSRQEVN